MLIRSVFFSVISKQIYGCLVVRDTADNHTLRVNLKICGSWLCSDFRVRTLTSSFES